MPPRSRSRSRSRKRLRSRSRSNGKHWKSQRRNDDTNYRNKQPKKEEPKAAFPKGQQPPHSLVARQHPGQYLYTVEGFVMSRQGDVWRTPLECRMEGPIRVPQIGVSHWRALLHAESLVEGPACGAQPGELEGCKSKRKAKNLEGKTPLFQNVIKNRIIPIFVGAIFNNVLV